MDCNNMNGQYTFCIHRSSDHSNTFFKFQEKSVWTVVRGTITTHFAYIVPRIPITCFKFNGKSAWNVVKGRVNTHCVYIVPLIMAETFFKFMG